jgi:hypothetical protein
MALEDDGSANVTRYFKSPRREASRIRALSTVAGLSTMW